MFFWNMLSLAAKERPLFPHSLHKNPPDNSNQIISDVKPVCLLLPFRKKCHQ